MEMKHKTKNTRGPKGLRKPAKIKVTQDWARSNQQGNKGNYENVTR